MNQSINCPVCLYQQTKITLCNYNGYDLLQCNRCGCEFCIPFKAPIFDFYKNASDSESLRRHTKYSKWHVNHPTQFSENLLNGNGKKLLDIGCGNGDFAEFASKRGFEVSGIDIDEASLNIAKSRNLKNTIFFKTTLNSFILETSEKYDVVTMFEVFEHLDNPFETLQLIKQILKPGGLFIGTLPNENRFFSKKINLNFAEPPYHLTFWTKETWTTVLEMQGDFKMEKCSNNVYYGYLSNIALEKSLNKLNVRGKSKLINYSLTAFFLILKKIESLIERLMGKSSSFYFEFRLINSI
jgi:SAM-dependent methyltransferase